MKRTTIMLDPGLIAELERIARRENRPTAHVIREGLERYVAEQRATADGRLPSFVGMAEGPGNVAEHDEAILRTELARGETAPRRVTGRPQAPTRPRSR